MKKYLFPSIYTILIILLGSLITSILYYFNITSDKLNSILLYLVGVISIFVGSLLTSKKSNKKGIISGLIYFIIFALICLFLSLIVFKSNFSISSLIYYIVLLVFSLLAGIIGKNSQTTN